jgi:hypothetical protein
MATYLFIFGIQNVPGVLLIFGTDQLAPVSCLGPPDSFCTGGELKRFRRRLLKLFRCLKKNTGSSLNSIQDSKK